MSKKVLFLGYSRDETCLIEAIEKNGFKVDHSQEKINWQSDYVLVISFGYRFIINPREIIKSSAPIINLHISYLPWNKGAHPNFWSHFDGTPTGVTIHLIDEGVDTGPIIFQKKVSFDKKEATFKQTYQRLIREVESLFLENIDIILSGNYVLRTQFGEGSYHKKSDLPQEFYGWDSCIVDEVNRLKFIIENKN